MTQNDKELLIMDLCARLPYGVIVHLKYDENTIVTREMGLGSLHDIMFDSAEGKPYLRPMSSMTGEEKEDLLITLLGKNGTKYFQVLPDGSIDNNDAAHQDLSNFNIHWINFDGVNTSTYIDWLNVYHFDYRGLIEKGLAIAVTKENNPYGN